MPKKLTGVVTRQLWDNPPVPSTVIDVPPQFMREETTEHDQKNYIIDQARSHAKLMGDTMVEFRSAKWKVTFMELPDYHAFSLPIQYGQVEL